MTAEKTQGVVKCLAMSVTQFGLKPTTAAALMSEGIWTVAELRDRVAGLRGDTRGIPGIGAARDEEIVSALKAAGLWRNLDLNAFEIAAAAGYEEGRAVAECAAKTAQETQTIAFGFSKALTRDVLGKKLLDAVLGDHRTVSLKTVVTIDVPLVGETFRETELHVPVKLLASLIRSWDPATEHDVEAAGVIGLDGWAHRPARIAYNFASHRGTLYLYPSIDVQFSTCGND